MGIVLYPKIMILYKAWDDMRHSRHDYPVQHYCKPRYYPHAHPNIL